jgi:hypothetical protein
MAFINYKGGDSTIGVLKPVQPSNSFLLVASISDTMS